MTAKKEAIRTFAHQSSSPTSAAAAQHANQQALHNTSQNMADDQMSVMPDHRPDELVDLDYNEISVSAQLRVKSFPNANVISHNYNQGILIVEGSSAEIIANKIEYNIKANIALGGEKTGETRIMYNYILHSKSGEGIFVVEGEKDLLIEDNIIESN